MRDENWHERSDFNSDIFHKISIVKGIKDAVIAADALAFAALYNLDRLETVGALAVAGLFTAISYGHFREAHDIKHMFD